MAMVNTAASSYTVGTKTRYTLNLDNVIIFPDNANIPVHPPDEDENWLIITELLSNPAPRPGGHGFLVKDQKGDRFPVIFNTPTAARDVKAYKTGRLVCLLNGSIRDFMPQRGFIVKDRKTAFMLPCNLATLRRLSLRLRGQSERGEFGQCCNVCKKRDALRSCRCKTRYCGLECQRADWSKGHSQECKILKALISWNRIDWWD
ncbi:hypothetical protein FB45DRAFT_948087 [Roridomyces roridus]|uniref:MYND-type domain-containing protein n=1 Tax=Roridomyces roridus TaxID=1738132 RepID=A0AAD7FAH5_9AGAR|nr:hypothetical protein FB45DRAFT_948087 [Roridomyces roridus]